MSDHEGTAWVVMAAPLAARRDWWETVRTRAGRVLEQHAGDLAAAWAAAPADVVVLRSPVALPAGWAVALAQRPERLAVATISAAVAPGAADAQLAEASERMARLGRAVAVDGPLGPCVLLTREAIELVGHAFLRTLEGEGSLEGFAQAASARGLSHVVSDRLVAGADDPVAEAEAGRDTAGGHALSWARQASSGITVTVDARSLVGGGAGTQLHTLELVRCLAAQPLARLRVVLPPETDPDALAQLRALPGVELPTYADVVDSGDRTDVVHRPYQVFTIHDLALLRRLGRRVVVTQQDQLLFRTRAYFATAEDWEAYRQACRIALAWADRTVFFTEHARGEALRDELLEEAQAVVVPIGADHALPSGESVPTAAPAALADLADRPLLLVLGTDLAHKNRPFAIRLARALRETQAWDGVLVLAGPPSEHGSSREEEQRLLAEDAQDIVVLGRVDDAGRRWLLERCCAVLYPSVEEGFGLMPFEAAAAGRPCLFAPVGAMAESLPVAAASLVPWDARGSAERCAPLLAAGAPRDAHVAMLARGGPRLRLGRDRPAIARALRGRAGLAAAAGGADRRRGDRPSAPVRGVPRPHRRRRHGAAGAGRTGAARDAASAPGGALPSGSAPAAVGGPARALPAGPPLIRRGRGAARPSRAAGRCGRSGTRPAAGWRSRDHPGRSC